MRVVVVMIVRVAVPVTARQADDVADDGEDELPGAELRGLLAAGETEHGDGPGDAGGGTRDHRVGAHLVDRAGAELLAKAREVPVQQRPDGLHGDVVRRHAGPAGRDDGVDGRAVAEFLDPPADGCFLVVDQFPGSDRVAVFFDRSGEGVTAVVGFERATRRDCQHAEPDRLGVVVVMVVVRHGRGYGGGGINTVEGRWRAARMQCRSGAVSLRRIVVDHALDGRFQDRVLGRPVREASTDHARLEVDPIRSVGHALVRPRTPDRLAGVDRAPEVDVHPRREHFEVAADLRQHTPGQQAVHEQPPVRVGVGVPVLRVAGHVGELPDVGPGERPLVGVGRPLRGRRHTRAGRARHKSETKDRYTPRPTRVSMGVRDATRRLLDRFPATLARAGVVERGPATEAFDLAVPVMVTGGLRVLLRMADFVFVGLAIGDTAIAALELAFLYYFVAFGLSLALTSGTISVVSRLQGAGERRRADLAVKQSLWLVVALSLPLSAVAWVVPERLVGPLSEDAAVVALGAAYLQVVMLSLLFRFWSMAAARALAGSGDTRTPMYVRLLTLPTNVALNAVLVFGLGPAPRLGVVGVALGTVIANTLAGVVFFALLVSGRYSVSLRLGGPQFDAALTQEIVRVAAPLTGMRLLQSSVRFPFLFVLGMLGTPVLAAYAIGRRVMLLALMPGWGYSTAASTLVGQAIGAGDEAGATEYGWQTLRIGLATQLLLAVVLVAAARPIAALFGTEHVGLAVEFIRAFGLATAGFSASRTMRGSLRGAGDTRWPLYGTLLGSYAIRLPIAALALPAGTAVTVAGLSVAPGLGLGTPAIFLAILGDFYTKAAVNTGRFYSGAWTAVARAAGVGATETVGEPGDR